MPNVLRALIWDAAKPAGSFLARYVLLVGYPELFFKRHIKDKGKNELKQTITDAATATAAVVILIGFIFYIPGLKQVTPSFILSILNSKTLLLLNVIVFSLPTFGIIALGMKFMRAPFRDSIFIYLSSLTLVILTLLFFIVVSVILQATYILLILTFGLSSTAPFDLLATASMFAMGVVYFGWLGVLFYVPSRLIEQSAKSSAFSAAILCVVSFVLPATIATYFLLPYFLSSPSD